MKKNLFLITEEERERILGMHKRATASQYLSEAGPFEDTDPLAATTPPAAGTTPPAAGTTPPAAAPTTPTPQESTYSSYHDNDYDYKKEGDKYFFKLKSNPTSQRAKQFLAQNKYTSWTEATGNAKDAIAKLPFSTEKMDVASVKGTKVTSTAQQNLATTNQPATGTQTPTTAGGGGTPQIALGSIGEAQKLMPNLKSLDPMKQAEVANWAKTPSGQYVLNTPADQREAAIDNLDRRRGDEETRRLKKEIRQALGMAADTLAGKVGSSIRGGIQGLKQGFQQQTT